MSTKFQKLAQKGFTLIELIITIVIIGVLAAVAIPKFTDLTAEAERGVALGIAGAGASASAVYYARVKGGSATALADCPALMAQVDMPATYSFTGALGTGGASAPCTVLKNSAAFTPSVTFQAYGS